MNLFLQYSFNQRSFFILIIITLYQSNLLYYQTYPIQSLLAMFKDSTLPKRYQNIQIVGNGTFGMVYLAKDLNDNKEVAIKHVHQNKKYKNRQLEIMKEINHSNIVKLIDHFYEDIDKNTFLNLIMEYIPHTLSSVVKNNLYCKTFISNDLIIQYSYGLLKALKYLQVLSALNKTKKIAHRDIKPSNILINDHGDAKLCDFGSAKLLVQNQKNVNYICSRFYRCPQLILGATDYSTAIDMWSLGCCICEMMINRPIFDGGNANTLLIKIIKTIGQPSLDDMEGMKVQKKQLQKVQPSGIRQRILKLNPDAPQPLIDLVQKMLVYNPQKRIRPDEALKQPVFKHLSEEEILMQE